MAETPGTIARGDRLWLPVATAVQVRIGLVLATIVLAFTLVAARDIRLPGLYYDELIQIDPAFAFARGGLESPVSRIPDSQVWLPRHHPLPLMTMPYIGAVKTVAYAPFAGLFGVTPESVRSFTIGVGALSLIATFLLARRLFGAAIALVTCALLASDPSFIFYSRVDFGPTVFMMLTKMIGLWLLARWWSTGSNVWLLVGSFALGLGVYDKADFIWVIAAALGGAVVVVPKQLLARVSPGRLALAGLGILLGAWPLALYNLRSSWGTVTVMQVLPDQPGQGQGLLAELDRLRVLAYLLEGREKAVTGPIGGDPWYLPLLPIMVGVAVVVIALPLTRRRLGPAARPAIFVVVTGWLITVAAALTPHAGEGHHVILAYPFPHLALAVVLIHGARSCPSRARMPALAALVIAPVAINAATVTSIFSRLEATGGEGSWSDSIYQLTDDLLIAPEVPVVTIDWGIYLNIVGLSQGRLLSADLAFDLNRTETPTPRVRALLVRPGVRYVMHAPSVTLFREARQRFFETIVGGGGFCTRNGGARR